jgi:hypothetical protein
MTAAAAVAFVPRFWHRARPSCACTSRVYLLHLSRLKGQLLLFCYCWFRSLLPKNQAGHESTSLGTTADRRKGDCDVQGHLSVTLQSSRRCQQWASSFSKPRGSSDHAELKDCGAISHSWNARPTRSCKSSSAALRSPDQGCAAPATVHRWPVPA